MREGKWISERFDIEIILEGGSICMFDCRQRYLETLKAIMIYLNGTNDLSIGFGIYVDPMWNTLI